jgi:hypothetical protein
MLCGESPATRFRELGSHDRGLERACLVVSAAILRRSIDSSHLEAWLEIMAQKKHHAPTSAGEICRHSERPTRGSANTEDEAGTTRPQKRQKRETQMKFAAEEMEVAPEYAQA